MRITLKEYFYLPFEEQLQIALDAGFYIQSTSHKDHQVILYAIDMFFVEIHFDYSLNRISNIIAFDSGQTLDKYSMEIKKFL